MVQDGFKKIILKVLSSESFNKLTEMPKAKMWIEPPKSSEPESKKFDIDDDDDDGDDFDIPASKIFNPSEYVLAISHNFFTYLQMLEEIMNNKKDSKLDEFDIKFNELY